MPRIRTIKPEFWTDEKLSLLEPITRLVFLGLISLADDAGRLVDNVKQLDGQLFPNTADSCRVALDTLATSSRIIRYRSKSGQDLIQVANWGRHQRVDKPNPHVLPPPPPEPKQPKTQPQAPSIDKLPVANESRAAPEDIATDSRDPRAPTLDLGPWTLDQRPSTLDLGAARGVANSGSGSEAAVDAGASASNGKSITPETHYAIELARTANHAISLKWREQPNPLHFASGSQLAVDLLAMGVSLDVARSAISAAVEKSKLKVPPKAMEYFRQIIVEAHRAAEQRSLNGHDSGERRGGPPIPIAKLIDPEAARRRDRLEREYDVARKDAGIAWGKDPANTDAYRAITAEVNAQFVDLLAMNASWGKMGRDNELVIRCATAAGFPDRERWISERSGTEQEHPVTREEQ